MTASFSRRALIAAAALIVGGCFSLRRELADQAEIIYAGTTMVNTDEANMVPREVVAAGHAPAGADARRQSLDVLYDQLAMVYFGARFRRQADKHVEWLPPVQERIVPSTWFQVVDVRPLPATGLYRASARARIPQELQKAYAEMPPIAAVGNADVTPTSGLLGAWGKAREVAMEHGIERSAWQRYGSKVPPQLEGTVYIEKYFQDPLAELQPLQDWHGRMQVILKMRVRLDTPGPS